MLSGCKFGSYPLVVESIIVELQPVFLGVCAYHVQVGQIEPAANEFASLFQGLPVAVYVGCDDVAVYVSQHQISLRQH